MKIDCSLGVLDHAAERAKALETAGYAAAWSSEVNHDPFLPLAAAAGVTTRIELGTSIAVAFARSPMTLAYTANDLQAYTRGRLLLGLGSQVKAHVTRRFSMPWEQPAAQMREFILAMRAIWSCWHEGNPLDFVGEYYRHTLMTPNFVPPPHAFGPPRVILAGVGEHMTRVAGEVADGFFCHSFTTERWIRERTVPAIEVGRRLAGATVEDFEVIGSPFIVTGSDQEIEAGIATARNQIAFYGSTPTYRVVLDLHGWAALGEELTKLSKLGRWTDMGSLIDDDVLGEFAIVAPPATLPALVAERLGGVVTRMSFTPPPSLDATERTELLDALRKSC
jgi:probable F420-dependent oxidoreductase